MSCVFGLNLIFLSFHCFGLVSFGRIDQWTQWNWSSWTMDTKHTQSAPFLIMLKATKKKLKKWSIITWTLKKWTMNRFHCHVSTLFLVNVCLFSVNTLFLFLYSKFGKLNIRTFSNLPWQKQIQINQMRMLWLCDRMVYHLQMYMLHKQNSSTKMFLLRNRNWIQLIKWFIQCLVNWNCHYILD